MSGQIKFVYGSDLGVFHDVLLNVERQFISGVTIVPLSTGKSTTFRRLKAEVRKLTSKSIDIPNFPGYYLL